MRKDLPVFCPTAQANYLQIIFARGLETRQHIEVTSAIRKSAPRIFARLAREWTKANSGSA
jgi:hypothetical protein